MSSYHSIGILEQYCSITCGIAYGFPLENKYLVRNSKSDSQMVARLKKKSHIYLSPIQSLRHAELFYRNMFAYVYSTIFNIAPKFLIRILLLIWMTWFVILIPYYLQIKSLYVFTMTTFVFLYSLDISISCSFPCE